MFSEYPRWELSFARKNPFNRLFGFAPSIEMVFGKPNSDRGYSEGFERIREMGKRGIDWTDEEKQEWMEKKRREVFPRKHHAMFLVSQVEAVHNMGGRFPFVLGCLNSQVKIADHAILAAWRKFAYAEMRVSEGRKFSVSLPARTMLKWYATAGDFPDVGLAMLVKDEVYATAAEHVDIARGIRGALENLGGELIFLPKTLGGDWDRKKELSFERSFMFPKLRRDRAVRGATGLVGELYSARYPVIDSRIIPSSVMTEVSPEFGEKHTLPKDPDAPTRAVWSDPIRGVIGGFEIYMCGAVHKSGFPLMWDFSRLQRVMNLP